MMNFVRELSSTNDMKVRTRAAHTSLLGSVCVCACGCVGVSYYITLLLFKRFDEYILQTKLWNIRKLSCDLLN